MKLYIDGYEIKPHSASIGILLGKKDFLDFRNRYYLKGVEGGMIERITYTVMYTLKGTTHAKTVNWLRTAQEAVDDFALGGLPPGGRITFVLVHQGRQVEVYPVNEVTTMTRWQVQI